VSSSFEDNSMTDPDLFWMAAGARRNASLAGQITIDADPRDDRTLPCLRPAIERAANQIEESTAGIFQPPSRTAIQCVGDELHPVGGLAILHLLNGNTGHGRIVPCPVPMFFARGKSDDVADANALDLTASSLPEVTTSV
jgi:hypothetical protein